MFSFQERDKSPAARPLPIEPSRLSQVGRLGSMSSKTGQADKFMEHQEKHFKGKIWGKYGERDLKKCHLHVI